MLHISNVISKHLKKNFDYLQFTHLEKIFHADEKLKMAFLIVSYFSFMYSDSIQYFFLNLRIYKILQSFNKYLYVQIILDCVAIA